MAAVVATPFEPIIRDFYQHLPSVGKPYKAAVTQTAYNIIEGSDA